MSSVIVASNTPFGVRGTILAVYQMPKNYYYGGNFNPFKPRHVNGGLSLDFPNYEIAKAFIHCKEITPYSEFLKLC